MHGHTETYLLSMNIIELMRELITLCMSER